MSTNAVEEGLRVLEAEILRYSNMASSIKEALEYADGQAYYDDKRRMEEYLRKAYVLGRVREVVLDVLNVKGASDASQS